MTLDAKFIGGIKGQHRRLVARSAAHVTAEAFHGQIFVALINDLGTDRVR